MFKVVEVGRDAASSHHVVAIRDPEALHRHDTHDLFVVTLRGHGTMRIGGETRPVGEGSVLYVPRATVHAFTNLSKASPRSRTRSTSRHSTAKIASRCRETAVSGRSGLLGPKIAVSAFPAPASAQNTGKMWQFLLADCGRTCHKNVVSRRGRATTWERRGGREPARSSDRPGSKGWSASAPSDARDRAGPGDAHAGAHRRDRAGGLTSRPRRSAALQPIDPDRDRRAGRVPSGRRLDAPAVRAGAGPPRRDGRPSSRSRATPTPGGDGPRPYGAATVPCSSCPRRGFASATVRCSSVSPAGVRVGRRVVGAGPVPARSSDRSGSKGWSASAPSDARDRAGSGDAHAGAYRRDRAGGRPRGRDGARPSSRSRATPTPGGDGPRPDGAAATVRCSSVSPAGVRAGHRPVFVGFAGGGSRRPTRRRGGPCARPRPGSIPREHPSDRPAHLRRAPSWRRPVHPVRCPARSSARGCCRSRAASAATAGGADRPRCSRPASARAPRARARRRPPARGR
ncbi:MAG: cupin domain-containing protein [Deltaproteobacteria bacterium]|nr:cupin domain-containing protein [Deltaproteobacteria bacterium]